MLGMFLDVYDLHGILETSRAGYRIVGGETVYPFGRIITGLVGGLIVALSVKRP